jgi:hypothetical protein
MVMGLSATTFTETYFPSYTPTSSSAQEGFSTPALVLRWKFGIMIRSVVFDAGASSDVGYLVHAAIPLGPPLSSCKKEKSSESCLKPTEA